MKSFLVTFTHDYTILTTSVETDLTDEYEIAMTADETIFDDIGFAPLQHCQDYTVEELN